MEVIQFLLVGLATGISVRYLWRKLFKKKDTHCDTDCGCH